MAIRATLSIVGLYIWDNTIFDDFAVPTGMDKSEAVDDILRKCGDLELLWPDWDFMKSAIKTWTTKNAQTWDKLYASTNFVYDPIANVDATITISRGGSNGGTVTNESSVAAYNTATLQPEAKTVTTPSTTWGDISTETRKGNIGITSSQELTQREREVVQFNVYDFITESFKKEFCLMVY